jgi:uncharacterized surface protein with fasciclin (FAS1) repeats
MRLHAQRRIPATADAAGSSGRHERILNMTSIQRRGFFALGCVAAGSLAAPRLLRAQQMRTIADTLAGDQRFSRFLDVITRASMVDDFRQASQVTVFAPVDQAFLGAPAGLMQDLLGTTGGSGQDTGETERQRVAALINYHVVPGVFTLQQLTGSDRRLRTVNGGDIQISSNGSELTARNPAPAQQLGSFGAAGAQMSASPAQLAGSPIQASNGVIYPISQILWP